MLHSPWWKAPLHSSGDASRLTALFENAAWRFLCVARGDSPEAAREEMFLAADPRFARFGGHMRGVAMVRRNRNLMQQGR